MVPSEPTSVAAGSSSPLRRRQCWQPARARRVRVSRRPSRTSSSPALHPSASLDSGSQPSGRSSVAARDLHCPRRCSWQTINVTGSQNQRVSSPCGHSCESPRSQLCISARVQRRKGITNHSHLSCSQACPPDACQPCSRTGSVCAACNSLAALADGVCCCYTWLKRPAALHHLGKQFQQHWGQPGALYQLAAGALYQTGAPQLTMLWTVQHPTPIPN